MTNAKGFLQIFLFIPIYIGSNICCDYKPANKNENDLHCKRFFCGQSRECKMKDCDVELLVEIKKLKDAEVDSAIRFFNGVLEELSVSKSLETHQNPTTAPPVA